MLSRLKELILLCLKIGTIGFGGPLAHIALLEDEVVKKRGWIDRQRFLDLVGATNLIPGPNSTEVVMLIGRLRAGAIGLVAAGLAFILPAAIISGLFGWIYVRYGELPDVRLLFSGIQPVVLVIILGALWRLGRTAVKDWQLASLGVAVLVACTLGANEVLALLVCGVVGVPWLLLSRRSSDSGTPGAAVGLLATGGIGAMSGTSGAALAAGGVAAATGLSFWSLALVFLKVGAVLYGSGYVLVAFLEGELVEPGWLTSQELLDAIAIGQITPGPLLSTASFIGFVKFGPAGAALATLAITLPSFVFVAILGPIIEKLRKSRWTALFLDSVNVCAVGLMAHACVRLGEKSLTDWRPVLVGVLAVPLVFKYKVQPLWLLLGGATAGWLLGSVFGAG